jgi:hypothetical protein
VDVDDVSSNSHQAPPAGSRTTTPLRTTTLPLVGRCKLKPTATRVVGARFPLLKPKHDITCSQFWFQFQFVALHGGLMDDLSASDDDDGGGGGGGGGEMAMFLAAAISGRGWPTTAAWDREMTHGRGRALQPQSSQPSS